MSSVRDQLQALVADVADIALMARLAHWNLQGPLFHDLHGFFGQLYEGFDDDLDKLAERVRALGGFVHVANVGDALPDEAPAARAMLTRLLDDLQAIINGTRLALRNAETFEDDGTVNLLADMIERHEKITWMLRASLAQ